MYALKIYGIFFLYFPYFLIRDMGCKAEIEAILLLPVPFLALLLYKPRNISWASVAMDKKDRSPISFPFSRLSQPRSPSSGTPPDHWFSLSKHHHGPVAGQSLAWSVYQRYQFLLRIAAGILACCYDGGSDARCCPNTHRVQ